MADEAHEAEPVAQAADAHSDWYQQLMARLDAVQQQNAQHFAAFSNVIARGSRPGFMRQTERPWWAPDAQGFLAAAIVVVTGAALFVRMFHTSSTDDKMLDTMITILFSTCLVTVYQFTFGSSRGSAAKDEVQTKLVDKLVPVVPAPTTSTTTTSTAPTTTTTTANP